MNPVPGISALAWLALLMHLPAAVADSGFDCDRDGNQMQLNSCAALDFEVADKELNAVYKRVMDTVSATNRKKILAAQRAWLKQRDPHCRREANDVAEGGSMWPTIYDGCRAASTKTRTGELRKWLQ